MTAPAPDFGVHLTRGKVRRQYALKHVPSGVSEERAVPILDAWDRVAMYARTHHGVVGSTYARNRLEVSASQLHRMEKSGRLMRVAPEAYVVVGSPQTWRQQAMVAVVSSHGRVSHGAAAALWELDGFSPDEIEVVTLRGHGRSRLGWRVRETRRLSDVDLASVDNIPCTQSARTIIDLAGVAPRARVEQALDDACRRWPTMLDTVTTRFLELAGRGWPGTKVLRELLAERHGEGKFTQSTFETITKRLVCSVGLPPPEPQHLVQDGCFRAWLDLA